MHRVSARFPIVLALLGLAPRSLASQQQAAPGWRLVYAVDSMGTRTHGEKSQLIAAVRAGLPVRVGFGVVWKLPDGTVGGVEHVAEAAFLTIHHDEVFAQLSPILGQTPAPRDPVVTLRTDDRVWYALLDTTGRLHGYFTGSLESRTSRTATYWYAPDVASTGPSRLY